MSGTLLVLNAGSSSIKFQLFRQQDGQPTPQARGQLDGMRHHPRLKVADQAGETVLDQALGSDGLTIEAAVGQVLDAVMGQAGANGLDAAGHRVVHGGQRFSAPALIDQDSLAAIEALIPLAPLHQPASIAPIRAVRARWPDLPQVACFDTVFHAGQDRLITRLPIPASLDADGIRRYGFHGLSYAYIAERLADLAPELAEGRVVVAHLGSGASLCAMQDGRSVETTMSFTALDGVPMGTRPGQLDPGVILYLMQRGWDAGRIERLLYRECGLQALSGISGDVRDLEASSAPQAAFALDYFAHRIAQAAASLATTMGGIDGLVFAGGIGERSSTVRAKVSGNLAWLGVKLDANANGSHAETISASDSRIAVKVVPTDEEAVIARQTLAVLGQA